VSGARSDGMLHESLPLIADNYFCRSCRLTDGCHPIPQEESQRAPRSRSTKGFIGAWANEPAVSNAENTPPNSSKGPTMATFERPRSTTYTLAHLSLPRRAPWSGGCFDIQIAGCASSQGEVLSG
jgi:hypothetical protein